MISLRRTIFEAKDARSNRSSVNNKFNIAINVNDILFSREEYFNRDEIT